MRLLRRDSERGQTLVEFGLIIPIVLLIMVGLFDLGRVVFINNGLSDGARQGARNASIRPRDVDYCARVDDAIRSATRGQPLTPYTVTFTTIDGAGNHAGDVRRMPERRQRPWARGDGRRRPGRTW